MPFKSKAQMRYMFAKHPDIAARWEDKYGISKNMPQHIKKSKKGQESVNAGPGPTNAKKDTLAGRRATAKENAILKYHKTRGKG